MVKNNYYHFTDVGLLWFEMQVDDESTTINFNQFIDLCFMYIHSLSLKKNDRGNVYLPWISFLLALLLDLQSMPEKQNR